MGLATIDSHSLKELTEIHKIPKFGVNQASFHWDTAIWKCQNLQRNVWKSGRCPTRRPDAISPVPELSFLPAPYRAGERRVQDNLYAHAQNEPIKNYQVSTTLLVSLCRAMPFSARALKVNIFFDVDIVIKNIKT